MTATSDEWLEEANANAAEDKKNFSKGLEMITGAPPVPLDEEFIGVCLTKVYPQLNFRLVERLARAFLDEHRLDTERIQDIAGSRGVQAISSFLERYRLQRMIG
jgi:hypothetical protein